MNTKDRWVIAKAIALYYYNVDPLEWAQAFQDKLRELQPMREAWHPDYAAEQMAKYARGFQSHFGKLDFKRQQIQLQIVLDRYGAEAGRAWNTCIARTEPMIGGWPQPTASWQKKPPVPPPA